VNELDMVRGIAADTPQPDQPTTQAARARLLAAIATEPAAGRDQPPARPARNTAVVGRRLPRRLLPAGAVAAALATALAAPLLLHTPAAVTPHPTLTEDAALGGDPKPTAARVLTNAALAAARAPAPRFGPGTYWYVLERGVKLGTSHDQAGSPASFFYRFPYQEESWWGADGTVAGRTDNGRVEFLTARERAAWVAAGRPDLGLPSTEVLPKSRALTFGVGWVPGSYQELVALPTQPERLAVELIERIRRQPAGGWLADPGTAVPKIARAQPRRANRTVQASELLGTIAWLLAHYPLPPRLQAALYQVLTRLDGVKLLGATTDLAGRRGVSIAIDQPGTPLGERSELLLDPAGGRLLGSRTVQTRRAPGWRSPPGTVLVETAYLKLAVVDAPNARP
jgi:hypothetical protein